MIYPDILKEGDRIAIVSPASEVNPDYIDGAVEFLKAKGFTPMVSPHAKGPASGSYSAPMQQRLDDLLAAFSDDSVKAVLCARGGYGAIHLLPHLPAAVIRENPKWLIGFSDISALHALMHSYGVASLHAPMAKHLTEEFPNNYATVTLMNILTTEDPQVFETDTDPRSPEGVARGRIVGGNLAVLNSLASTPFDLLATPLLEDTILFIEDINEAIYATERMLSRLYMSGILTRVKGLIFGHFTDYRSDRNYKDMETMILERLRDWHISDIPVAVGFPVGHHSENLPIIEGARAMLSVTQDKTVLIQTRD